MHQYYTPIQCTHERRAVGQYCMSRPFRRLQMCDKFRRGCDRRHFPFTSGHQPFHWVKVQIGRSPTLFNVTAHRAGWMPLLNTVEPISEIFRQHIYTTGESNNRHYLFITGNTGSCPAVYDLDAQRPRCMQVKTVGACVRLLTWQFDEADQA